MDGAASHPYLEKSWTGKSELGPNSSSWILNAVAEGREESGENDVEVCEWLVRIEEDVKGKLTEFQEIAVIFAW